MKTERIKTDILIIGGGTAGCYAALTISENSDAQVLICEKAHIKRSGCLKSENIKWYDGEPLLEYLETVDIDSENEEKEFENFINEYYSLNDAEKIISLKMDEFRHLPKGSNRQIKICFRLINPTPLYIRVGFLCL